MPSDYNASASWTCFVKGCSKHPDFGLLIIGIWTLAGFALSLVFGSTLLRIFVRIGIPPHLARYLGYMVAWFVLWPLCSALVGALSWLSLRVYFGRLHSFPLCAGAVCCRRDYGWRCEHIFGWKQGAIFNYTCNCGYEYIRYQGALYLIDRDGSVLPFRRLSRNGVWERDDQPIPAKLKPLSQ